VIALALACAAPVAPPVAVFPWTYTPETDLEPYEEVRWETETWDPLVDLDLALLYAQKSIHHRPSAPVESLDHFAAMREEIPPLQDGPRISFVGDVMWIGDNWAHYADGVADLLDGDLRVGNLETPTDPGQSAASAALGIYAYNSPPALLDGLPLDLVQLDNNHSMDAGDAGIEATIAEVEARGIAWTGVDRHAVEEVAGTSVALLSYTWGLNVRDVVSAHELFVVPFGHVGEEIDLGGLAADIAAAKADGAERVVVLVHWGFEYEYYPDPHFLVLGREIIAAGADLVVGSGPHVAQPVEICEVDRGVPAGVGVCAVDTPAGIPRTAAIVPSLANFGASPSLQTLPTREGLVVTASFDAQGVSGLGWRAVGQDVGPDGPFLAPIEALTSDPEWAAEEERLVALLGAGWRR
jgi:poly-gamma-glutamate synthesis protein (capsule biosynthesis protein)